MKIISSRQNPEIIDVTRLKQKKYRDLQKRFYAEGIRTCSTLVQSGIRSIMVYVTEHGYQEYERYCMKGPVTLVTDMVMEKLSDAQEPSGIVGVFAKPEEPSWDDISSGMVLAEVSDPGNMGALIRSCAAFNAQSVIIIGGADVWHPKVVQASAGTHGYVAIISITWPELMEYKLPTSALLALVSSHGISIDAYKQSDNAFLVVGNEAHGIPEAWVAQCDERITITMPGKTESLNAAVAGSIALYEFFACT
jgi:TrmH family RNA methyltransferase